MPALLMLTVLTMLRLLTIPFALALLAGCAGQPDTPPAGDPLLCPPTPNCVTSMESPSGESDADVAPIRVAGGRDAALARLRAVLADRDDARVISDDGAVIHAEFTTPTLGFVDDVIFLVEDDGIIHLRSASRLGLWDWGANRARVDELRASLERP